jgi:GAF domain-containing protein
LKISVEQARKVIKLDRVIVYQFDASWNGNIVAESVVPGYPRGLNSQIKDPCFAKEYGEKYRQGRIKAMPSASFAIANIHQANLTDCHLEQLESLAVKASLVVPILQDDQLFGLLIGHQCEKPRLWSQSEIDLFAQLALQLGFALDRVKLREKLDLAQDSQRNKADRQQLEQESLNQKISELLKENQAALQSLQAKISRQSSATGDFINQISEMSQKTNAIINEDNLTVARKAIAQTKDQVEMLNQSHQNLYQMVNLIDDLKEKMDYPVKQTKPAQLPMGEIIVEASEITLNPPNKYNPELDFITGQFTEGSQSAPSLILMNQFIGEITNLSSQISQQSLFVTESFQKLAAFTRQLSERDKL